MKKILKIQIDSGVYTCSNCKYLDKGFIECNLFGENLTKERGHYYRCYECSEAEFLKIDI